MILGSTRVFAILGDPVAHSLSPVMHNAAFRALGLDVVYVPLRCSDADLPQLMGALSRAGGGGNVTIPHKESAARTVGRCLGRAEVLGAVNTFWGADSEIVGENTDVAGVSAALDGLAAPPGPWFVLGTGGGARAVAGAAKVRGVSLAVASRSADRRRRFEEWAGGIGVGSAPQEECTAIINTTPLGLEASDGLPLERPPARAAVALDMVYTRGETPWVRAMRNAGLRAGDGRTMLVAQGAAAFNCWFPNRPPPVEIMKAAVDAALR